MQIPIFLSGKVTLDDGTPPQESAVIERVCNGVVRPEGYTDSKGRFSIRLGENIYGFMDASVGGDAPSRLGPMGSMGSPGVSERDLMGCEIRASLPGYVSDIIPLAGRRALDNPEIGRIVLHRYGNVEGTMVSASSLGAPKDAQKAYEKGLDAKKKQKWADAKKEFDKAVGIYPRYAAAWFELGLAAERLGVPDDARKDYAQALAIDAKYIKPYLQIATLEAKQQEWPQLVETASQVLKLDPYNYPGIYYFDSVAKFNLRNLDGAEKSAREAVKMDKAHAFPGANHILGLILATKGEFTAAAGFLKTYLQLAPTAPDAALAKSRLAETERLAAAQAKATP